MAKLAIFSVFSRCARPLDGVSTKNWFLCYLLNIRGQLKQGFLESKKFVYSTHPSD